MVGRKLVALLIGAALFAGVAPLAIAQESPSAEGSEDEIVLTTGVTADIETDNIYNQVWSNEWWMFALMYQNLVTLDQVTYEPTGELAESFEVSDDGLTWTFTLREGLKWSDGEPLTSEDVVWTSEFDRKYSPSAEDTYRFLDSIEATDERTIVWKTTQPTWIPGSFGITPMPKHIWAPLVESDDEEANQAAVDDFKILDNNGAGAVGSGPFILTKWVKGQYWEMERNPNFWGEQPTIDKIVFRVFQNDEAVVQALRRGTVDHMAVPTAALFEQVQNEEGIEAVVARPEAYSALYFNLYDVEQRNAHPAVDDPKFREAVGFAINREELVNRVLLGQGTPGSSPIPPIYDKWHLAPPEDAAVTFDPERAKQLLDEAGYVDTDNDGIREMPDGGRPLDLRLYMDSTDSDAIAADPFITEWLRDVGIGVESRTFGTNRLFAVWTEDYDWDLLINGWSTTPNGDTQVWSYTTGAADIQWSDTGYHDEDYDELYEESLAIVEDDPRREVLVEMQEMLYRDNPALILWYPSLFEAWRSDKWEGMVRWPEPDGAAFALNPFSAITVTPTGAGDSSGGGIPPWIWIVVGVVVVGGGGLLIARNRKKRSGEIYS